jgi:hypothetical protein
MAIDGESLAPRKSLSLIIFIMVLLFVARESSKLLALKLSAWRDDLDVEDARRL